MPASDKEAELRRLGSCYEVLSAAVEFDRKDKNTLKIRREALKLKEARAAALQKGSE